MVAEETTSVDGRQRINVSEYYLAVIRELD